MPTLYVENVPGDLYEALRERARQNRKSMAAEVLSLLEENLPTREELRRRRAVLSRIKRLRSRAPISSGASGEEMQRQDRLR